MLSRPEIRALLRWGGLLVICLGSFTWTGCQNLSKNKPSPQTTYVYITNLPPASEIQVTPQVPAGLPPVPKTVPGKKIDLEAERQVLLETDVAFSRASENRGAAQAFYEFLAPDAVSLPMDGLPIQGRDAIRVQMAAGPQYVLVWKPAAAEVSASGDLGYTWGNFEQRMQLPNGRPQTRFGKYITVWKKQPDGSWKAVLDGGNLSPAPQQRR